MSRTAEIRFVGDMKRLRPRPGDVFVLQVDHAISGETEDRLRAAVRHWLGADAKVLVLSNGLRLGVVGAADVA